MRLEAFHIQLRIVRKKKKNTLIQNLVLSSTDLNAVRRQSAAHTATSSRSAEAIGLEPGFNSRMKNSLNVCPEHKDRCYVTR